MDGMTDGEAQDVSAESRPLESHRRWLASASDIELCRALIEQKQEFLPAALEGIAEEVGRRLLDPEAVLRSAPRRIRPGSDRRRYLYGGLVIAGLGLIPALVPRARMVEILVYLDNPGSDALRVNIGDQSREVPGDFTATVPVKVEVREAPLWGLARRVFGSDGSHASAGVLSDRQRLDVAVEVHTQGGRLVDRWSFDAVSGMRAVISLLPGATYELRSRRYRLSGRVAVPDGEIETVPVIADRRSWDLDRLPTADGTVFVDFFETAFPAAVELPRDVPQGGVVILRRLVRR